MNKKHTLSDILIIGPSWVGDMIMAQSLFKRLREEKPNSAIDVVAPPWSLPLISRMPEVRQGIPLEVSHGELGIKKRRELGKRLRGKYHQAIIIPRSLKAALVPFFASISIRTGYRGEARYGLINDCRVFDRARLDQTVKRYVNLGSSKDNSPLSILHPKLAINSEQQKELLRLHKIDENRPCIAVFPGAEYGPAKQWPIKYYQQTVQALVEQGYQALIFGSAKDEAAGMEISQSRSPWIYNLCGKTRLTDAVDLIAHCCAAISNDSGLMHVAAAVDCPVIAIYGSSSPSFTPPLTNSAKIIYRNLGCSPCFDRECSLGHLDCMNSILPEDVLSTFKSLTSKSDLIARSAC